MVYGKSCGVRVFLCTLSLYINGIVKILVISFAYTFCFHWKNILSHLNLFYRESKNLDQTFARQRRGEKFLLLPPPEFHFDNTSQRKSSLFAVARL